MKRIIIELPLVVLFLSYSIFLFLTSINLEFAIIFIATLALVVVEFAIANFKLSLGNWVATADYSICKVEEVQILAEDGISLAGSIFKPFREQEHEFDPLPVVMIIHGIGSNRKVHPEWVLPLIKRGYAVLTYDLRGHGNSGGKRKDLVQLVEDIRSVLDFVQNRPDLDIDRVALLGHSLGGLIALSQGYNDPRVSCVIGIAAPHDIKAQGTEKRTFGRKIVHLGLRLLGLRFNLTEEENQQVSPRFFLRPDPDNRLRVFLIHARDDFIDYQTQFLANVLTADLPKSNTLLFQKGGHQLRGMETVVVAQVLLWLEDTLGKPEVG
ncbi:MAG TPA: alpha/beta fold hydrolase [Candidatus Lokiarchaeia archaeon]|nr:alpha/beta fold hydrolase [Candidatus Lokiarchaeia archaeon]